MTAWSAVSPVDGTVFAQRTFASRASVGALLDRGVAAQRFWRRRPLEERLAAVRAWLDEVERRAPALAAELTTQMGRPVAHTPGEISGFLFRGRSLCDQAPAALADLTPSVMPGFERFIRREALGLVLVLAPWNYPWLTAVNALVPALLAGNTVLLKHSEQVPWVADRLAECARTAGLPDGVFQTVDMANATTARVVADERVASVLFTGSVAGGRAVHAAAGGTFKAVGLELGGKDAAYVRADADLAHAVPNIVEGFLFNAGQSCCAVERIYVHDAVYDDFIEAAVAETRRWRLGDPLDAATSVGPMVRVRNADLVRAHVQEAVASGAKALLSAADFPEVARGDAYVAPQICVDVTADMRIMHEETFGPVVGVVRVRDDAEAIAGINHSDFGLTASVWSRDVAAVSALGDQLEVGTVFMNRCDYLDPELAWVGVKDSGRGVSLSALGFGAVTRPKSFHLRTRTG